MRHNLFIICVTYSSTLILLILSVQQVSSDSIRLKQINGSNSQNYQPDWNIEKIAKGSYQDTLYNGIINDYGYNTSRQSNDDNGGTGNDNGGTGNDNEGTGNDNEGTGNDNGGVGSGGEGALPIILGTIGIVLLAIILIPLLILVILSPFLHLLLLLLLFIPTNDGNNNNFLHKIVIGEPPGTGLFPRSLFPQENNWIEGFAQLVKMILKAIENEDGCIDKIACGISSLNEIDCREGKDSKISKEEPPIWLRRLNTAVKQSKEHLHQKLLKD